MQKSARANIHRKKRFTIGLISENSANELENRMRVGVIKAAQKHNVNLICFTHLEAFTHNTVFYGYEAEQYQISHDVLQQLIDEFEIDGLLFLGWSLLFEGERFTRFKRKYAHIPILSLGKHFPETPSVLFVGDEYIEQLLVHLIEGHQYRKIAFLEHWYPDSRGDVYKQTMKKYGLYDPDLFIGAADLEGIDIKDRPSRALSLLLDQRKVTFEAIMTMKSEEGRLLLAALRERGIRVPEDIAVTTYEDDLSTQYSNPTMTTIEFPFEQIGFAGCEKMVELLTQGSIPIRTQVPGRLIIRRSCGCLLEMEQALDLDEVPGTGAATASGPFSACREEQQLEEAFFDSLNTGSAALLNRLEACMSRQVRDPDFVQRWITGMRERYAPYNQGDLAQVVRFENLCHAARIVGAEMEKAWLVQDTLAGRRIDMKLEAFGQALLNTFHLPEILDLLETNLDMLQIPGCSIFLMTEGRARFDHCRKIYEYADHVRHSSGEYIHTRSYYREYLQRRDDSCVLVVSLLHVEKNILGFISFEAGPPDGVLYLRLAILLSNALMSTLSVDKLTEEIRLRKEKERQLHVYANFDMLTGLRNRRSFYDLIERLDESVAFHVLYLDVDGFKAANDTLGHNIGDQLLAQIADRVRTVLKGWTIQSPGEDQVGEAWSEDRGAAIFRIGGDEFAALLKIVDDQARDRLIHKLIDNIRQPYWIQGNRLTLGCSIGVSSYPADSPDRKQVLQYADIAMYRAKKNGGSSFKNFDHYMLRETVERIEWINDLRLALERGEFRLVYQPQVESTTRAIKGVEALIRWRHPVKGNVSPNVFIPLAEETGLIGQIGEWVLREACRQLKLWRQAGMPACSMAVNLSVKQFEDDQLVEKIEAILQENGLDPSLLELEITENIAMEEHQLDTLQRLRRLGISISVDDFGTQYSSLSYLKRFPVTKLKLDRSFVRGIQSDPKDREMIKAIISVAKLFDLEVLAEGVETLEEADYLVQQGCTLLQGYYFYRPMEPDQVFALF
jgi:predicted signal transduction protein with EAL and GGDEF domain/DNA-binding LacI/PurR family transcriptional regulator